MLAPETFARFAARAAAAGIRYVGGCCGAGPEHIRAMARVLGKGGGAR